MNLDWLTAPVIIQLVITITILIAFFWKLATKDDIKSLKADTERDVETLRAEINNNMSEIREDLREARQNHLKHLNDHANPAFAKHQTSNEGAGPPSIEAFKALRKGESTADERDKRTRS